jgi:hypothetical protein
MIDQDLIRNFKVLSLIKKGTPNVILIRYEPRFNNYEISAGDVGLDVVMTEREIIEKINYYFDQGFEISRRDCLNPYNEGPEWYFADV